VIYLRQFHWEAFVLKQIHFIACMAAAVLASGAQAQAPIGSGGTQTTSPPEHSSKLQDIHLHGDVSEVLEKGFGLFGIQVVLVSSPYSTPRLLKIDINDADLNAAGAVLSAMTHCFFVTLDSHLILAVPDDRTNQAKFQRLNTETFVVPNLAAANPQFRSSVVELLTSVFGVANPSLVGDTAVVRASPEDLYSIRKTLSTLYRPEPQVLIDVKTYVISRTHNRNTGVQLPRKVVIFNVYSEAESLISSNSSIVQELIQAGLVTAGDTLGIAELLVAEGYASNSVLGTSSVYFGGGKTATGLQFDSVSGNASLSVSSVKELQETTLHLITGQSGTLRVGQRYPILTSTTSSLGSSSNASTTPTIQYEDLGLTLEAKLQVVADKEVLVHLHETIRSLAGTSLNNIPILDNQDVSTDLSIPGGVTTVLVSNLNRSETLATQGVVDAIPTDSSRDMTESQLVITITPVVTRITKP
jgi:general secretion pathway protein D